MHSYADLVAAWRRLRHDGVASVREVACVGVARTLLVAELPGPPGAPAIALAAGVHGDEPAGPWALLSIVRDGLLDRRFTYRIWPCTNPTGYELGTRANADGDDINRSFHKGGTTPEARAMIVSNRDRRFALSLDLHEDFEADGYYCYEPVVEAKTPFGGAMVRALDDAAFAVQELDDDFDLGYPPEGRHLRTLARGHIRNDPDAEREFFDVMPYSIHLLRRSTRYALTLESPRTRPWDERIAMHRTAVTTILAAFGATWRDADGDVDAVEERVARTDHS
ncbi:MAG: hypothetical protein NVS1B2_06250 [Vulcanimicrobiaceae bacterium]